MSHKWAVGSNQSSLGIHLGTLGVGGEWEGGVVVGDEKMELLAIPLYHRTRSFELLPYDLRSLTCGSVCLRTHMAATQSECSTAEKNHPYTSRVEVMKRVVNWNGKKMWK